MHSLELLAWFDADMVITNMSLSLPTLLARTAPVGSSHQACSVVIGSDEDGAPFNTGLMLLHRAPSTLKLLSRVGAYYNDTAVRVRVTWEQWAMGALYRSNRWARQTICVVPRRPWLQSFVKWNEWRAGDFAAHLSLWEQSNALSQDDVRAWLSAGFTIT